MLAHSAGRPDLRIKRDQLKVEEKSNKITAGLKLRRARELAGGIVTLKAMGCQKEIAQEIIEADAD